MSKDYIPSGNPQKLLWAKNFAGKLPENKAALGLTDDQVKEAVDEAASVVSAIEDSDSAQATAHEKVNKDNAVISTKIKSLRSKIQNYKTVTGYTNGIGEALQIIGSDTPFDPTTYQPKVEAQTFPGHVTLKFTKKGVDGVNVYERLKGDATWTKLSFDSHSPYVDNRPLAQPAVPEAREYMCIGVIHDAEVGQMSDIVSVVFGG